jgi:preprotein translocase subunit SecA
VSAPRNRQVRQRDRLTIDRVRSSASARLGVDLRESQVIAGTHMLGRCIAEMHTGEGKTLSTVLPAAILAAPNRKVLIATANDYLATRDAEWMGPILRDLGFRVGCITSDSTPDQRLREYDCEITYGTLRRESTVN